MVYLDQLVNLIKRKFLRIKGKFQHKKIVIIAKCVIFFDL